MAQMCKHSVDFCLDAASFYRRCRFPVVRVDRSWENSVNLHRANVRRLGLANHRVSASRSSIAVPDHSEPDHADRIFVQMRAGTYQIDPLGTAHALIRAAQQIDDLSL